jgi:two-component system alkaline phosphatase synthesis response regulator PhoP
MNNLQDFKILVVDDEKNFREILRLNLQKAGFVNIQEATNGNEALELLPIFKPDLVILDVIMPDKDGIDVALEIKSKEEFKNTKFIFLTNYGEDILKEVGKETDKRIAQELGALDFFRKTDDINVLINKIKEILKV